MVDSPKTGQVRTLPENDLLLPLGKKPRFNKTQSQKTGSKRAKKRRQRESGVPDPCSTEDVLWRDIIAVVGQDVMDKASEDETDFDSPFEYHQELELEITSLCSSGDAIALSPDTERPWAVVVPLSLPGEKVRVRIYRNARMHSLADLLEVITPNLELRDPSRVKCKYFGSCGGCQYQMLSYETQLDLKRDVIVKAYKNFSNLPETSIPPIQLTMGSPLQYGYRTKLTPHFEAPKMSARKDKLSSVQEGIRPEWLNIGFNHVSGFKPIDIEECPIATCVINEALPSIRKDIIKNIYSYKKGASLIFRDSLVPVANLDSQTLADRDVDGLSLALDNHVCITDHKATVREKVGQWIFEYHASSFFQNNNSVLPSLTDYVRDAIFPPSSSPTGFTSPPTHLVDAYCGAGLFAITLSPHFATVAGIELSVPSINFATRNAKLNNIPTEKCTFRAGDAADIFAAVSEFPPDKTVLVIDPPRKGCDDNFIRQLLVFRPQTVVYVSCNVHTQARDIGAILNATEKEEAGRKYVLESLRGFDLFPQTAHVESVAVLRLV
ncbi:S-adenosyl-L-methionine-dependent methyltransferase [Tricholoma matsutake]|nr:S-adenosyl-L-methionine-dependent methyltransferase [Tricholoma matsutake 945]